MKGPIYILITIIAVVCFNASQSHAQSSANTLETGILTDAPDTLPLERLYASPSLSGPVARSLKYSPDGARVTFLKSRTGEQNRFDLWQYDVSTGEQSMLVDSTLLEPESAELSEEEKALRERRRIAGTTGFTDYSWGSVDTLLVPITGDLHLITLAEDGPVTRKLTNTDAFEYDARFSPLGNYVSFVRNGAVYAIDLRSGIETRLPPRQLADRRHLRA